MTDGMRASAVNGVDRPGQRQDWAVDAGFLALLVACALRYFSVHSFAWPGVFVLVLAVGAGLAYVVGVVCAFGRVREVAGEGVAPGAGGVLTATALWFPLVLLAPSFGWVAFALFFAVHRVIPRGPARWVSGAIVAAVSAGMFVLSRGQDLGLVFGPMLGGIVLSLVYVQLDRALQQRNRLIDELMRTQQRLAASEREAGALVERTRVAGELHDTVVQQTATALLLLEAVDNDSAQVLRARDVLRDTLLETRQLMHGLTRPRPEGTLVDVLAEIAAARGAEFMVIGGERPLPDDTGHVLQRVCQEALTNAQKHAAATRVRVTLTFFDDEVGLDISDDGMGFDMSESANSSLAHQTSDTGPGGDAQLTYDAGYGLRAMAWRAENAGGTLVVETAPGRGTVVAALLPAARVQGEQP
ncbi:sensor histidine kinase [Leucobacter sp. HY1910]